MIKYRFECIFLTPAFVNGASEEYLEVTPTSVKGGIMFWWRALYGPRETKELKKESFKRFGGAFKEEPKMKKGGLTVRCPKSGHIEKEKASKVLSDDRNSPLNYMAYGEYDTQTKKTAGFIDKGKTFTILLQTEDETDAEEYLNAFFLLSYFGGLGAKSRNGFGQFEVTKIRKTVNGMEEPFEWPDVFKEIRKKIKVEECGYHERFDKHYGHWITKVDKDDPMEILEVLTESYLEAKGKLSSNEKRIFTTPYENRKQRTKGFLDRFSKSYFLSINKTPEGKYRGSILFFKIKFHAETLKSLGVKEQKESLDKKYEAATNKFNEALINKQMDYLTNVEL